MLTALELACFGAISLGMAIAGWAVAGPQAGLASGLISGGLAGVYLVNAYSLPPPGDEPDD